MMVKEYLRVVGGLSRRLVKAVKFQGGNLTINGEFSTVRKKLTIGDELIVTFPQETKGSFMHPEHIPLDIVYEDADVMVINKPAHIATIPSLHHTSGTIANGLLGYYEKHNLTYTVHIVTRLDRDTSGLLLVAKHRFSHSILSKEQKLGSVNRSYFAIVEGTMNQKQGTIDAPIARKDDSIIERMVKDGGQHAITHYQVLEETDLYSLVDVRLETGRTHQIRVHFSHIGHPLVGDDLYGGSINHLDRQALHCKSLEFTQPITKQRLHFKSQLPLEMRSLLK
ncbi:RluA family pseudouridine synthase [Aquibacillus halophilus]|uniref:Pseudouridine synthase n=2 Tax=Aquibacillus halophilus TaxID=930132 RepID=A0A6A8DHS9_9BACI|nr:RluA family pseudouridine synthase [Aquibacillus halophilus]MRH43399.1 RluA family pseudouridine synthase [Aquibacillus halophilus]